jgi:phosphatidylserine decarboxylase
MMWLLFITPKKLLSRLVGWVAQRPWPSWLQRPLNRWFATRYQLNMQEALPYQDPAAYSTWDALFTRAIDLKLRPLSESSYVHPADSRLISISPIHPKFQLTAKQVDYTLDRLAPLLPKPSSYLNGRALLYYLCPTDYHRVHSPVSGQAREIIYVPGSLWPVNDWSQNHMKGLFYKNERLILPLETPFGPVAVIMVGATNVGQMSLCFEPSFKNWAKKQKHLETFKLTSPIHLEKGDELGTFHLGSTVIVLLSEEFIRHNPQVSTLTPQSVRVRSF